MASSPGATLRLAIFSAKLGIRFPPRAVARRRGRSQGEIRRVLDQLNNLAQERCRGCPVRDAMIHGEIKHHRRLDGQALFCPRTFPDLPYSENGTLAGSDDCLKMVHPVHPEIAQGADTTF